MDYLNEAKNLEGRLFNALQADEVEKFNEVLKIREGLYRTFAEESPEKFREYLYSEDLKDIVGKINRLYEEKREGLRIEMRELDKSRKAAEGYIGNSSPTPSVFSKSV